MNSMRFAILLPVLLMRLYAFSQCATVNFTASTDVCLNEAILLTNNSLNADSYEWNFCTGGLSETPTASTLSTVSAADFPFKIETVSDGTNIYSFFTSLNNSRLFRVNHGTTVQGYESTTDLDDLGGVLVSPLGYAMIEASGIWYGFVALQDGSLYRLTFTDGLAGTPTTDEVTGLTEFPAIGTIRGLDIVEDGGDYKLLAVGGGGSSNVIIVDFGTDITTGGTESSFNISGSNIFTDIDLLETCDGWYALASTTSNSVQKVDFGSSISATPTSVDNISGTSNIQSIQLVEDRGQYFGLGTSSSNVFYRLTFDDISSVSPTVDDLGSVSTLSDARAFTTYRESGNIYGVGINRGDDVFYVFDFPSTCDGSLSFSSEEEPFGLNFTSSGDKTIYLTGIRRGVRVTTSQSVNILSNAAPSISFTTDNSRCIDNPNTFTASTDIFTYSWDFNGEGTSTNAEETFQFTSTGEKTIELSVDNGTCTNTVQETITIYEAPPVPVFDVSGDVCESSSLEITNSTDDAAWSDAISYTWTFDEDSMVTEDQPNFAFLGSGNRSISVISSIPGCTSEAISSTIVVNDTPGTDYSISPTCDQEVTNFTNLTTGAASYEWDFGDDFTSTQTSPSHLYQAPGDYSVSMIATNSVGCSDTLKQVFSVDYLPVAGFRAQLPCEGAINLIDTSSVAASDIIAWSYSIESIEQLFADQNPELILDEPGDYEVTQQVTSNEGCRSTITETISVQDAADAAMEIDAACFGDSFHFSDISSVSADNRVISRIWNFEGQNIEVGDTSIVEIDHTFSLPGIYDVSLTLTTQNLCTSTISRSVEVLERPELGFDIPQICQNDFATFTDLSASSNDAIVSRQWVLNGALIGNGTSVSHKFTVDGENDIWLVTTTSQGCIDTLLRSVNVLSAPQAAFEASSNFGIEGSSFSFTNTSTGSETYQWLVDGQPASTDINFETVFDASGNRDVSLIAFSEFSCADTTTLDVLVRVPEIDVVLSGMRLVPDDRNPEFSKIQVSVENRSNLPVDGLQFVVEIDDQPVQSTENIFIPIGESRTTELGVGVPVRASYICVEAFAVYDNEDLFADDNSRCINIEPEPVFPPVYPNPARDEVSVDAVLPAEGDVTISLLDISGKVEIQETYSNLNEGLQSFTLEIAPYGSGMYFIKITYGNFVEIKRFVKQ